MKTISQQLGDRQTNYYGNVTDTLLSTVWNQPAIVQKKMPKNSDCRHADNNLEQFQTFICVYQKTVLR